MRNFLKSFCQNLRQLMAINDRFLVVVCGCTGTGKSDLGIEIAKKFNGEIISSDSMQVYKGLDIATNKVTPAEMQDIPHHMMSFYDPHKSDYNVHCFRDQALEIMEKIWQNEKLPIIVGGTSYYVESILYDNYLIRSKTNKNGELFKQLDENTTDDLYSLLQEVDPESASQTHRNNRYRVLRALEIYYATGKRKSEHLREQRKPSLIDVITNGNKQKFGGTLRFSNILLLNLDADTKVLDERLNKRVEKMIQSGLRQELEEFYDTFGEQIQDHGILQSIGLKEFLPYLSLKCDLRHTIQGDQLFQKGCDLLKVHTRQYSRKQRNWMYRRILLRSSSREIPQNVSFNTSSSFYFEVVPLTLQIVGNYLAKKPLLHNVDETAAAFMSLPDNAEAAREMLASSEYDRAANLIQFCEYCKIEVHGAICWKTHLEGRKHRNAKAAVLRRQTVTGNDVEIDRKLAEAKDQ